MNALSEMRLFFVIPCFNERDQLARTVAELPRVVEGFSTVEVLIVDDGSTDATAEVARDAGVHYIVRWGRNRGLAASFRAGTDAALRLGADIVVMTDADNQYCAADAPLLVAPILAGRADIVVGDRQTDRVGHFSPVKRLLQRWGSRVVRRASGTTVNDAASGFRAMNRAAILKLFVHGRFSSTLETLVQAGERGLVVENVPVRTNPPTRPSRLFRSIPEYVRRQAWTILRAYNLYWPVQTFSTIAIVCFLGGAGLVGRFFWFYFTRPASPGHVQSLVIGVGLVLTAFLVALLAVLSDLLATNRRLLEDVLFRVRRIEAAGTSATDGIEATGAPAWTSE